MKELTAKFLNGINYLMKDSYEPSKVARFALEFYLDYQIEDEKLAYVVDYLRGIDAGPEFELTRDELDEFIRDNLIK